MKETVEENIFTNQGMSSKGLKHKQDHSLIGIKFYFMVIVWFVMLEQKILGFIIANEVTRWTKGSNARQERRELTWKKGKGSNTPGNKEYQHTIKERKSWIKYKPHAVS
jgi:hypothetical protein